LAVEPVAQTLSEALQAQLRASEAERMAVQQKLQSCAKTQSLAILAERIVAEIATP
jgi:hypothetical protein